MHDRIILVFVRKIVLILLYRFSKGGQIDPFALPPFHYDKEGVQKEV
jgi:hypothetical protein